MSVIEINYNSGQYSDFSNQARYPIKIEGKIWPTAEHYYQAMKFYIGDPKFAETIRLEKNVLTAISMGEISMGFASTKSETWDEDKDEVLYNVLYEKFTQHPKLRKMLLETGDSYLQSTTRREQYNTGDIIMKIREKLKTNKKTKIEELVDKITEPYLSPDGYELDENGFVEVKFE